MTEKIKDDSFQEGKSNDFAYYSIISIFIISLIGSVQNIEKESILPFFQVALLVSLVSCSSFLILLRKGHDRYLRSPLFFWINFFGVFITFSSIYSKYPLVSFFRSLQFVLVSNSLYFILSYVKDLRGLFESILRINIKFAFLAAFYGMFIYLFGEYELISDFYITKFSFFGFDLSQRMYGHRISSFLGNPNTLGIFIMISIISCLYFFKKNKLGYALLILFFIYVLVLTGSRASMIGLIAGGTIFVAYNSVKNSLETTTLRFVFVGIFIAVLGYILSSPEVIKTLLFMLGRDNTDLSGREVAWAALMHEVKENPFFGIGYRTSTEAVLEYNLVGVSNSHNLYLSMLSETGLIGLLLFVSIYAFTIISFFSGIGSKDSLRKASVCILISILINQFFEDVFYPLGYLFIFSFLMLFASNNIKSNS